MTVRVALYRGRFSGNGFSRFLAWWARCDWSHAAVLWGLGQPDSDGNLRARLSEATWHHGVVTRWREWVPGMWDVWEIDEDALACATWWARHDGDEYDWRALFGFVWRRVKGLAHAAICSEAVVASATRLPDPWRWDVALLACYLRTHGRRVTHEQLLQEAHNT